MTPVRGQGGCKSCLLYTEQMDAAGLGRKLLLTPSGDPAEPLKSRPWYCDTTCYQKNPRVRKILVRNSGAGNGCANLMDTWKNCVLSAGKPMSIKFLLLGVFWVWGGGVPILFLWARGFF